MVSTVGRSCRRRHTMTATPTARIVATNLVGPPPFIPGPMTGAKWVSGVKETEFGRKGWSISTNRVRPGSPRSAGTSTTKLGRTRRHEFIATDRQPSRVNTGATARMASGWKAIPTPRSKAARGPAALPCRLSVNALQSTIATAMQSSGCPHTPVTLATPNALTKANPSRRPSERFQWRATASIANSNVDAYKRTAGASRSHRPTGWPECWEAGRSPGRPAGPAPTRPREPEARSACPEAPRRCGRTDHGRAPTNWRPDPRGRKA